VKARFRVVLFAAGVALTVSGCSGSSTTLSPQPQPRPQGWRVQTGGSSSAEALQGLNFYPSSVLTIDAGDTVTWSFPSGEAHTVTLLAAGQATPPPASDPNVAKPAGGNTYDGNTYTSSGFKLLGANYSLQFTKAGTYKVYCLIHQPEMEMTIVVQAAGASYPHPQSFYDAAATTALGSDLAAAAASVTSFPYAPGGLHLAAGIAPGPVTGASTTGTVLRFLSTGDVTNQTTTVPVGSTVTWTNLANNEPHTVTFAPVGQPFPKLDPFSPPTGGNTYDGTTLVNSGLLLPGQSFSATFPKAGTYTYHCLLHDDTGGMISTLVVQ